MGLTFSDVNFSVILSPNQDRFLEEAFLIRALNSNRFFAFIERNIFNTPHLAASCYVEMDPIKVELKRNGNPIFKIGMGQDENREIAHLNQDGWHGMVVLPGPKSHKHNPFKYFIAKIEGETIKCNFDNSRDSLFIANDSNVEELSQLIDSGFKGKEWMIRRSANHSKSKSYSFNEVASVVNFNGSDES
jgi:hypothetical protein